MAESREPGSSAFVVLGLVMQEGEISPYDLKQRIATSVGYFWAYSHPQIYQVTQKLEEAGLLTVRQEKEGRRRKLYKITASGQEAFETWLNEEVDSHMELRDLAILKLYFGGFADKTSLQALAAAQQVTHKERKELYEKIPEERNLDKYAMLTLELGIRFEKQAMQFWAGVAKDL